MKEIIEKFIGYLRYERNASPETVDDYGGDVQLFEQFLTPPGAATLPLAEVDHRVIREFVSWLYDRNLQKVTVARKLSALRTFFKFCVREKYTRTNPAALVSTPKLPEAGATSANGGGDQQFSGWVAGRRGRQMSSPARKKNGKKNRGRQMLKRS